MVVCTLIYMAVAVTAIGALPFQQLANSPAASRWCCAA
jgi:APA family basic amino acid/polyamine antiporter